LILIGLSITKLRVNFRPSVRGRLKTKIEKELKDFLTNNYSFDSDDLTKNSFLTH